MAQVSCVGLLWVTLCHQFCHSVYVARLKDITESLPDFDEHVRSAFSTARHLQPSVTVVCAKRTGMQNRKC
jgi:hypothetical protein